MPPAARVTDMHVCPKVEPGPVPHVGGPILPAGEPTVLIGFMPAARKGDMAVCVGPPDSITGGSGTVKIGNKPAARLGDATSHGGAIVLGCPTVLIGDSGSGGAGGGGGGSAEDAGTGAVAGVSAVDVAAQIASLQSAAAAGMAFCQQCSPYSAPPAPKPPLKPNEKGKGAKKPGAKGPTAPGDTPAGGEAGADSQEAGGTPADGAGGTAGTQTAWIGFELVNREGEPIAGEPYEVVLANGEPRTGTLDSQGKVRFDGIDPGSCMIKFPKLRERRPR